MTFMRDSEGRPAGLLGVERDITERNKAETQIREQYSILESIIEGINSPIYSVDTDYRYTSFNQTHAAVMKSLYGVDIEIGKSILQYVTVEADRVVSKRGLDRALSGDTVVEEAFFGEEGLSRRYYEISRNPIRSAAGQIIGVTLLANDITATRKAKETLRRTQLAVDQSGDSVFWLTPDGKIFYANDEACRRRGYTREEILSLSAFDINIEFAADPVVWENLLNRLQESGHFTSEFSDRTKGGEVFPVEATVSRFEFEGDEIFVANLRDITERKKAEDALKRSEAEYRAVVEDQTELVVRFQKGGIMTFLNDAPCSFTGLPREELLGTSFLKFIPEEEKVYMQEQLSSLDEKNPVAITEHRVVLPKGEVRWMQWTNRALFDEQGRTIEFQGVGRDVTERKKMEEELRRHRDNLQDLVKNRTQELEELNAQLLREIVERELVENELRRVNEELEDYAKLVSHEIRTPLSGILLALEYLERLARTSSLEGNDSEVSSIVESAKEAVSRTEHNVDRLLKLAKAGQVPEDIDDVDVSSVVQELARSLGGEMKRKSAAFESDHDLGVVRADPLHVHLIFSNLISNALKYCDNPRPFIEVRMLDGSPTSGNTYLVKDNGSGIPAELVGELTESPVPPKSGLGMAIVGKIVKVYGGSMTAYNNGGACIEFVLHDYLR